MANIFIYGSCVSRDAYEYSLKDHHNLLGYIARQSWISATTPPSSVTINEELASPFQNRMIQGDISSNLLPHLREVQGDIDLLLMDWIDERLGVLQLDDGSFITRSFELLGTKPKELLKQSNYVQFDSAEFFELWKHAALIFKEHLDSLGLADKALIVVTPGASHNDLGKAVKASSLCKDIPTANRILDDMADYAQSIGFSVTRMPQEYAIADSNHKWGETPYHYADTASQWIVHEIERALTR